MIGKPFSYVNIFEDQEIREGLKEYSNWPTFPQLYVNGELIGGCDIVMEMYQNGELANILSS
jgi:monothiol glutaredoxin